jgi:tetratricopeptide (TPR) repeat protein
VGVIVLCCLGFTAFALRYRAGLKILRNVNSTATALASPRQPPVASLPPARLPVVETQLPPEVLAAQDIANSNPDNLGAQFDLALIYWISEMPDETYATLDRIIKLAGPDKALFYIGSGEKFLKLQAWPPAAIMYFQAVKFYAAKGKVPLELLTVFHETVYKSAEGAEAMRVLPVDEMAKVDEPISLILRGRSALYAKDFEQAYLRLDEARKLRPGMHEAILLEAEISSMNGKLDLARKLSIVLSEDKSVSEWIRIFAEQIIKRLP